MTNEALQALFGPDLAAAAAAAAVRATLAFTAATGLVMAARIPVRRMLGARTAYKLWTLPPLATLAYLVATSLQGLPDPLAAELSLYRSAFGPALAAWVAGALAVAGLFALAQLRFLAALRAGEAGPAVVGLISPRIVMPPDDGRYSAQERELIRAHEREHVARKHPREVAAAAFLQCVLWFNPLVHWAAYLLRLDQELACDAAVVLSRPKSRALYAKTLLKTQLAAQPLPLGCYWPARGLHPLEVRVAMLKGRSGSVGATGGAVVHAAVDAIRP